MKQFTFKNGGEITNKLDALSITRSFCGSDYFIFLTVSMIQPQMIHSNVCKCWNSLQICESNGGNDMCGQKPTQNKEHRSQIKDGNLLSETRTLRRKQR